MLDLPRDPAIERAVLSAFMLNPVQYARFRSRLTPDLFTVDRHAQVAQAMDLTFRSGLDITIQSVLTQIDRDETLSHDFRGSGEGVNLLAELTVAGIPSSSIETYLKIAEEWAAKRNILRATEELAGMARNGSDSAELARMFQVYAKRMGSLLSAKDGVNAIDLRRAITQPLEPIPWIANGWLAQDDRVIFGGEWASGKSIIALDLALSVACNLPWMGQVQIEKSGPVLYVDEENPQRVIESRLHRMVRGRNLDPETPIPITYLSKNHLKLDRPYGLATLRSKIEAVRPVFVALDSLVRFHSSEENSNTEMADFFGEVITPLSVEYGCAFLILDHLRKPGKDDDKQEAGHRLRGAGTKADVGDTIWTVFGDRDTDSRTLQCRKNRSEESLPAPMVTRWVKGDDGIAAWIEATPEKQSCDMAIWAEVNAGCGVGALRRDVLNKIVGQGVSKRGFEKALGALRQRGAIKQANEGGKLVRLWVKDYAPENAK